MLFELSKESFNTILETNKKGGKKAVTDPKQQKELLMHIRDIEKKIKFLDSDKEKAVLFYEIGLIWRDQIRDMRSAIVNFQKSYEADNSYLPNLKAVREIFITKKNWDFVLDIIDTELNYLKDESEILYLITLKSEILNIHKKDFKKSEKTLLDYLRKTTQNKYFIIRKLKALYFQKKQYDLYGKLIENILKTSKSESLNTALIVDIVTLKLQKKYKPEKNIVSYLKELNELNENFNIPYYKIDWNKLIQKFKKQLEQNFDSNNLYIIYKIYKDILKDNSEANKILIGNYQNIKDNFLLLNELENHYAENYNWEKLIDIQKRKVEIVESDEEKSSLYYKAGEIYLTNLNNKEEAKKYFKKALEYQENNFLAIKKLSKIAYLESDIDSLVSYHLKEISFSDNSELNSVLYFKIAEIYLKAGNFSMAEKFYLKSIEENEGYYPSTRAILKLYRANNQWVKVINILKKVISNSSDEEKILSLKIEIGKIYYKKLNNTEKSSEIFKNILNEYDYNIEAVNYLEEIYKKNKLWDNLIELYNYKTDFISDLYEKINLLMNIADIFYNYKEKNDAIGYLKQVLELSPNYIPALQKLGAVYRKNKNWNELIALNLNEIEYIGSEKKKSILFKEIGEIYKIELNEPEKAVKYFEMAIDYDIDNAEAFEELEFLYINLDMQDKLIKLWDEKIDNISSNKLKSDYSCKIAEYYIKNNPREAISRYWQALRYNPDNKIAFESLKNLYLENKEIKNLINLIMDFGERNSSENSFYIAKLYYLYLNNFLMSEKYLHKAIKLSPEKEYYEFLIRLYFDNAKYKEILSVKDNYISFLKGEELNAFLEFIISFSESNPETEYFPLKEYIMLFNLNPSSHFFYKLFSILYKSTLWNELITLIEIRLKNTQNKTEIIDLNYHLGLIYEYYQKDYESALVYYQKVIDMKHNHFLALQGKNRIYNIKGDIKGILNLLDNENYDELPPEVRNEMLYKNSIILIEKYKRYDEAEILLQKLLKYSPEDDRAFNKLYDIYLKNNEYKKILNLIDLKIPTINDLSYKENLLIKKSEIILMINPNDITHSIEVLKDIIKINPNNLKAKMKLINFYFREKNYDEVLKTGEKLITQNLGPENYQKILYFLFKAYDNKKMTKELLSVSDMLLERNLLSFEEMNALLPLYQKGKTKQKTLKLLEELIKFDSPQKISYIIDFLNLSKDIIDEERWHEKILHWLQTTKSIELLTYYSSFFVENSEYERAISILEENLDSYGDINIKSSIHKKLGDLQLILKNTQKAISEYKAAIGLNGNISALNKLRKIYSSDESYIEETIKYYTELIQRDIEKIFLIEDLFYIYKKQDDKQKVFNTASIIYSLKLNNEEADKIYKNLKFSFPETYNLYGREIFPLIKAHDDDAGLRVLFKTGLQGLNKLTKKTAGNFENIERITARKYERIYNIFENLKENTGISKNIELYINFKEDKKFNFIYPDNPAIIMPKIMLDMDKTQLRFFLMMQTDRLNSLNFLLNYHSTKSLIKFFKIIVNYAYDSQIFQDEELTDYYKLFLKGISRSTKKKLYSIKENLNHIDWKNFNFIKYITATYKTSLYMSFWVTQDINITLRAILKYNNMNNLVMNNEELLQAIIKIPEIEEIYKFAISENYNLLLKNLNVGLTPK